MKLLLIAPTCDGDDVGEAWVGYQWATRLAERTELTVLTYYKRGHRPLSEQLPGVRVIEWTELPLVDRAERLNSMLKPSYLPFYHRARRWVRKQLAAGETFDCAYQPVPVGMRYPSPLASLGIPYVLGPVGGGLTSPPGFESEERGQPWFMNLRRLDHYRLRFDPMLRAGYSHADCVLGIADYVADVLREVPLRRFETMTDVGIGTMPPKAEPRALPGAAIRLLFVGRLVRTKGVLESIGAMNELRDIDLHLDVIGEGPSRSACDELIRSLELSDRVSMRGRLPRNEVDQYYAQADVFVFPSYREPGGSVVFEAMSYGLPAIVVDRGGPGANTDETCAERLAATDPAQLTADIASAVRRLAIDHDRRARMGAAARQRTADVGLWPAKVDRILRLFADVSVR